jgi:hypothetical protein
LHQGPTLAKPGKKTIEPLPLTTLLLSIVAFSVVFAWLMIHRIRIERWNDALLGDDLDAAIVVRQNEGRMAQAGATV